MRMAVCCRSESVFGQDPRAPRPRAIQLLPACTPERPPRNRLCARPCCVHASYAENIRRCRGVPRLTQNRARARLSDTCAGVIIVIVAVPRSPFARRDALRTKDGNVSWCSPKLHGTSRSRIFRDVCSRATHTRGAFCFPSSCKPFIIP